MAVVMGVVVVVMAVVMVVVTRPCRDSQVWEAAHAKPLDFVDPTATSSAVVVTTLRESR